MNNGIELLRLFQRRTPDGDACFFGTLGDALVSVTRDQRKRDVWIVTVHSASQDMARSNGAPARAIAPPADDYDRDDGDRDEGDANMDDDISEELIASLQPRERR